MARVSKKVSAAQREAENAPHRIWKTAIYARLSDSDAAGCVCGQAVHRDEL